MSKKEQASNNPQAGNSSLGVVSSSCIDFESKNGYGNKTLLDITKYGSDHLEIQIIDNYELQNEETKFFILTPERIKALKYWLNNYY
jgi:hypothetical protein